MPRLPIPEEEARKELADALDDGRMTCAYCGQVGTPVKVFGATVRLSDIVGLVLGTESEKPSYRMSIAVCAGCGEQNIFVKRWYWLHQTGGDSEQRITWHKRLFPVGRAAKALPNTPAQHVKAYLAACRTLDASPEASACMSRRCLQGILSSQGYTQQVLAKQIEAVLAEIDPDKMLPRELRRTVDFIRKFGNLGAHATSDRTTLEIIDVEPGEADWCIEIAEQLMDHYFERPAMLDAKIDAANAKQTNAAKTGKGR
jgi:hypothetical protein